MSQHIYLSNVLPFFYYFLFIKKSKKKKNHSFDIEKDTCFEHC